MRRILLDGVALDGTLTLNQSDVSEQYVALPSGCLSGLTDATFEAWIDWSDTSESWQRVFEFGDSVNGDGQSYVFLTPKAGFDDTAVRAAFSTSGYSGEDRLDAGSPLSAGVHHLAVVVDGSGGARMRLYIDGTRVGDVPIGGQLADIADENCWLGRSQYTSDPFLAGSFNEFRIYDAALDASQVRFSYQEGPNPSFF